MQQWLYQRQMRLDIDGTQEGTPVTVEFDIHTKKVEDLVSRPNMLAGSDSLGPIRAEHDEWEIKTSSLAPNTYIGICLDVQQLAPQLTRSYL